MKGASVAKRWLRLLLLPTSLLPKWWQLAFLLVFFLFCSLDQYDVGPISKAMLASLAFAMLMRRGFFCLLWSFLGYVQLGSLASKLMRT